MRKEGAKFILQAFCFLLVLVGVDRFIFGSEPLLALMYKYRPGFDAYTKNSFVQKQMLGLELLTKQKGCQQLLLVGSSSVVNGVDTDEVQKGLVDLNLQYCAHNVGLTGFLASELPHLQKYLLNDQTEVVVYLYNTFSFADSYHPDGVKSRWHSLEYLFGSSISNLWRFRTDFVYGLVSELFYSVKYRDLIRELFIRWFKNDISTASTNYDYPVDEPEPQIRPRMLEAALPNEQWDRKIYLESDTDNPTLGYAGLRRFLEIASKRGVRVIVAPMPEPEFSLYGKYRQGILPSRIDSHVQRICTEYSVPFISRAEFAEIESNDRLFRDEVHLHAIGRQIFSKKIPHLILAYLPK